MSWYEQRGLVETKFTVLDTDLAFAVLKAGDKYKYREITRHYSCGRIDLRGTDDPYGDEIGLPPMLSEDWARFGHWLKTVETEDVWTLDQLVAEYEKKNPKITWWNYE